MHTRTHLASSQVLEEGHGENEEGGGALNVGEEYEGSGVYQGGWLRPNFRVGEAQPAGLRHQGPTGDTPASPAGIEDAAP